MGASTAYYLAKAGIRSTIIERDGIATKASGYNAGGLNPLTGYGLPGPLTDISNVTFDMHADLARPSRRNPASHTTTRPSPLSASHSTTPTSRNARDPRRLPGSRRPLHIPLARRHRPPQHGTPPQPRSTARPLHPRPLLPQRLRIHPRPSPRSRAQRRADTPHGSNRHRHRRRPRNRRQHPRRQNPLRRRSHRIRPLERAGRTVARRQNPVEPYKGEILRLRIPGDLPSTTTPAAAQTSTTAPTACFGQEQPKRRKASISNPPTTPATPS